MADGYRSLEGQGPACSLLGMGGEEVGRGCPLGIVLSGLAQPQALSPAKSGLLGLGREELTPWAPSCHCRNARALGCCTSSSPHPRDGETEALGGGGMAWSHARPGMCGSQGSVRVAPAALGSEAERGPGLRPGAPVDASAQAKGRGQGMQRGGWGPGPAAQQQFESGHGLPSPGGISSLPLACHSSGLQHFWVGGASAPWLEVMGQALESEEVETEPRSARFRPWGRTHTGSAGGAGLCQGPVPGPGSSATSCSHSRSSGGVRRWRRWMRRSRSR